MTTSSAYDSDSLDALKRWFFDMQKELHVLGPLLPHGYGFKTRSSHCEEGTNVNIERFLKEMLVQYGERSVFLVLRIFFFPLHSKVIYKISQVSFGSFYWPSVPEYVDELIEALIAKKAPFVRWTTAFHRNNLYNSSGSLSETRFLLMRHQMLHYRNNCQKKFNHRVWEW